MKFRNVCVFFVKCMWFWILGRFRSPTSPHATGSALGLSLLSQTRARQAVRVGRSASPKAGYSKLEGRCGGRYWVSRWGRRFPAFWLDSKQKMHDLKCVARCRRDVIGWHLWERFWVDILKFFLKKWLIRFRWFLGARSRRMFMEVIFLWSIFRFACLTLYICFLSLFFTLPVFALYSRFLLCEWSVC